MNREHAHTVLIDYSEIMAVITNSVPYDVKWIYFEYCLLFLPFEIVKGVQKLLDELRVYSWIMLSCCRGMYSIERMNARTMDISNCYALIRASVQCAPVLVCITFTLLSSALGNSSPKTIDYVAFHLTTIVYIISLLHIPCE